MPEGRVLSVLKVVQCIVFPAYIIANFAAFGNRTFVVPVQGLIHPGSFAIVPTWLGIYGWEIAALFFVAQSDSTVTFWRSYLPVALWCTSNIAEAWWSISNAKGPLDALLPTMIISTVALLSLGFATRHATGKEFWLSCAPFWFHAGWVTTVTLVNASQQLASTGADVETQFDFAFASPLLACGLVLLVLCLILATTRRAVVALPYAVSVSWALIGVLAELSDSGRASACPAWEAIGEEKQATLQTVAGVSLAVCAVLAVLSAIAFARQESGAARERSTLASGPARICKAEYGRAET
jgi:hypothetical protein